MAAGIGRFIVDRGVDQADEGFEQGFQLLDQQPVGQARWLPARRAIRQLLIGVGERNDFAAFPVLGIDQLQHADDFVLVVAHRHGQK